MSAPGRWEVVDMGRRVLWATLVVGLISSLFVVTGAEAKPGVLKVQAGAFHPTNPNAPYEYTRFYPDVLKVHRGQTLEWKVMGFHTVTYSKVGFPGYFRRDEAPGTYALPEKTIFGSGCGTAANPCVLNASTKYVSTSVPFDGNPRRMRVDLPPGKYRLFCQIHPHMRGTVEVVGSKQPVPSQRQVNAQIAKEVRKDTAAADAVFKAGQTPRSTIEADGARAWRVLLGDETPDNHVSILAYLPTNLKIAPGDRVRYGYRPHAVNEFHTATFPTELAGGFDPIPHGLAGFAINFACDFDSPTGGLPGVIGFWPVMGPPCPATTEALWGPWMTRSTRAPQNSVLTPATYHDSGIVAPRRLELKLRTLPDTGHTLPSTFSADFPAPGRFTFECTVHGPFMSGSIEVAQ